MRASLRRALSGAFVVALSAPLAATAGTENLKDGEELQTIPPSEYRYLRWSLGTIAPGTTETVRARVRVSALAAKETAGRH